MDEDADAADVEPDDGVDWSLLGLGGVLSLCCLFGPAAAGVGTGTAAAGTTASLGGGLLQIAVSAVTIGAIGAGFYLLRSR